MKTLNPLQLLLASCLVIAGCAQEPQQRALVIGGTDIGQPIGSVVVDGGFDIPTVDDIGRGDRPCRVEIKLKGVYYSGDDIGRDWKFRVSINNNQPWTSDWLVIQRGTWAPIDEVVFSYVAKNSCELMQLLFFVVRARERDFLPFDDTGIAFDTTATPCLQKMTRRQLVMTVIVRENFHGIGMLKAARLNFVFDITSVCLTP